MHCRHSIENYILTSLKSLENFQDFFPQDRKQDICLKTEIKTKTLASRPRQKQRPQPQDQDQVIGCKSNTKTKTFETVPRGVSRPRPGLQDYITGRDANFVITPKATCTFCFSVSIFSFTALTSLSIIFLIVNTRQHVGSLYN